MGGNCYCRTSELVVPRGRRRINAEGGMGSRRRPIDRSAQTRRARANEAALRKVARLVLCLQPRMKEHVSSVSFEVCRAKGHVRPSPQ
ncbi:unnamed protein product [Soboliphyme baturini]|uniref:BHLH domain-containing protein n=1 Tax=Soboliphyme baturini TaxID=241478 RepID=A0A183IWG8_9BILA|nr:unnamed protein product [Soboliphyme baturini]